MASKEVFTAANGVRLIGELTWRVLDAGRPEKAALRSAAAERVATAAATVSSSAAEVIGTGKKAKTGRRIAAGFLVTVDDSERPGKKAHSLAAAFAKWAVEHVDAILSIALPNGQHAVVVLKNGLPVLDKVVLDAGSAYSLVKPFLENRAVSIFADNYERFPSSHVWPAEIGEAEIAAYLLQTLAACSDTTTQIRPIPLDAAKIALGTLVVLSAVVGYLAWKQHAIEEERRLAAIKAAEEDPLPKYLNALGVQRVRAGIKRKALIEAFEASKRIPARVNGWRLSVVRCSTEGGCIADFERATGTFESLVNGVAFLAMEPPKAVALNQARMRWDHPLEAEGVGGDIEQLSLADFVSGRAGSQLQNWMVAGLGVQLQAPALWPTTPGIPSSFKHPKALARGAIEVAGVVLPLLGEVINAAPENVVWTGWEISVSGSADGNLERAKATVRGNYYVRN